MIGYLKKITEIAAALLLAALVIVVFSQVVSRYFLELSLSWPEELARYILVWLVFIGGAAAVGAEEQLIVDTLLELSTPGMRRIVRFIAPIGALLGVVVLLYTCLPLFGPSSHTRSPATNLPLGYVYLALPVGSVLAGIFLLDALYRTIRYPEIAEKDAVDTIITESKNV